MFHEFWRPDYVVMHADFYEWQFHRNPYIPDDFEDSVLLALDDDTLVGFLGLVPTLFHVGSSLVHGTWLSNWLSHPDYRHRGIGVFLLRNAMDRFPIVASTALSESARPIYHGLRFQYLDLMDRLLLIFDPLQAAALLEKPDREATDVLRRLARRVARADLAGADFRWTTVYPPDAADLVRRVRPAESLMATRDIKYLTWRYTEHPSIRYYGFVERCSGDLEGLAVVRIETVRHRRERVGRLIEWFASEAGRAGLASRVLGFCRSEGCAFVDFFCTSRRFTTDLEQLGFISESEIANIVVPYLFQPLDHSRRGTNVVVWHSLDGSQGALASHFESWYVTKGDNDQDRPN